VVLWRNRGTTTHGFRARFSANLLRRLFAAGTAVTTVATNIIVGRCTASAIASALRESFFRPLE